MSLPPRLHWECSKCAVRGADPLPAKCWNCGRVVVPAKSLVLPSAASS